MKIRKIILSSDYQVQKERLWKQLIATWKSENVDSNFNRRVLLFPSILIFLNKIMRVDVNQNVSHL